ncbi:hypothetical protein NT05HA_1264 [Aggregatibacter aphrophilus NJ8700]|nr:hypothetical protein NT05HA_1264 [Aggregatibacter aphrophilus NJ8700]
MNHQMTKYHRKVLKEVFKLQKITTALNKVRSFFMVFFNFL